MTDYLERGSLTVISSMTFTKCLCETKRHGRERGRVEGNGFLSVFSGEKGSNLFICDYYAPPSLPDAYELDLM